VREDAILVTGDGSIDDAISSARACGSIGLDTEFMRERTYRARLCLVQIGTREGVWLIDPLDDIELKVVAELISDPEVEIVVHAGKQDFELFYERYETVPSNVLDIQLAAGFAGYGASLPYGRLVEALAGVQLNKGESYTDWCSRPLTDAQLHYAADDVRYLNRIAERLGRELLDLGRTSWAREEMRVQFEDEELYRFDPDKAWRRVSGRGTLKPRHLAVLKELASWREEEALKRNVPRGWLVKDPTLVEIARRGPSSVRQLKRIRGLNAKEAERSGPAVLAAAAEGREAPEIPQPVMPPKSAQARARMLSGLADAMVRARCEHARIATELVTNRAELETLLAQVVDGSLEEGRHRLLSGWRRDLAGDAVIALAQGHIALRAVDGPPYIEEVPMKGE
jgi:ribonuclease D